MRIAFISVIVGVVFCQGCGNNVFVEGGEIIPSRHIYTNVRAIQPAIYELGVVRGLANSQVGVQCSYPTFVASEPDGKGTTRPSKIEVDWGDGTGFVDLTHDEYKWVTGPGSSDPQYLSLHTYLNEGQYIITPRVTFGDGSSVEAAIEDRPRVRVGRYVITYTHPQTDLTFQQGVGVGPVGSKLGATMSFFKTLEGAPGSSLDEVIDKVEIDWGEGDGFVDVTSDALSKWFNKPEGAEDDDPAYLTVHTFNTPGEYEITGRVTYWDGVVVTEDEETRSHLRIVQ